LIAVTNVTLLGTDAFLSVEVDVSNYPTNSALALKQDTLTAGDEEVIPHTKILLNKTIKSLIASTNVTMLGTDDNSTVEVDLSNHPTNVALALKADTSYVNEQLALKRK
jgi:hypothetical protein